MPPPGHGSGDSVFADQDGDADEHAADADAGENAEDEEQSESRGETVATRPEVDEERDGDKACTAHTVGGRGKEEGTQADADEGRRAASRGWTSLKVKASVTWQAPNAIATMS